VIDGEKDGTQIEGENKKESIRKCKTKIVRPKT
jgi:hypothetical protein